VTGDVESTGSPVRIAMSVLDCGADRYPVRRITVLPIRLDSRLVQPLVPAILLRPTRLE
jgi:hypothetical protein